MSGMLSNILSVEFYVKYFPKYKNKYPFSTYGESFTESEKFLYLEKKNHEDMI
jgi:hypothetical protein